MAAPEEIYFTATLEGVTLYNHGVAQFTSKQQWLKERGLQTMKKKHFSNIFVNSMFLQPEKNIFDILSKSGSASDQKKTFYLIIYLD